MQTRRTMNRNKDETGLWTVLAPFEILAVPAAVWLTLWGGCTGALAVAAFIGSWILGVIALVILYILFVGVMSLTVNTKNPAPTEDHPFYRRVVVSVIGLLCAVGRLRIHVRDAETLPKGRFLLVSNHRSGYDPIATVWALRRWDIAFITKPENLRIPIAGPMIFKANYLPIDRENPRRAMDTIRHAAELLENDVVSVGVYPEGTRGRGDEMLPFHNGVFKIAQRAGVPSAVCSIQGTERIKGRAPFRATDIYLRVCAVLRPDSASSAELGERVREILTRSLAKEPSENPANQV